MARPKMPGSLKKGNSESKAQREERAEMEERLKGETDILHTVPSGLCELGAIYYNFLVDELEISDLLCNLDVPLLKQTADCLAKMDQLDEILSRDGLMIDVVKNGSTTIGEHPAVKTKLAYLTHFRAFATQLGLSPSARASLAGAALQQKMNDEDPVVRALRGDL